MEMGGTVEKANSRRRGASSRAAAVYQGLSVEREAEFRERKGGSRKEKIALRAARKVHWERRFLVGEEEAARAAATLAQSARGKGASGDFRGLNGRGVGEEVSQPCKNRKDTPTRSSLPIAGRSPLRACHPPAEIAEAGLDTANRSERAGSDRS
jgi:hypothetical protein